MIEFVVPAIPVAQPRQRHAMIGGHVRSYVPTKHPVNAFKAACQLAASSQTASPLVGCLDLQIDFVFPRPASKVWKTKAMPREWKPSKPDADNLAKSVKDSLNGLLWRDDSQVVSLSVRKWIAAGDEMPHCRVVVREL